MLPQRLRARARRIARVETRQPARGDDDAADAAVYHYRDSDGLEEAMMLTRARELVATAHAELR